MSLWRAFLGAALLLGLAFPAQAHRLDEYLLATTVAIDRNQATLQLNMTPGVSVAPAILAQIDANQDGNLSPAEQQAYVEAVREDLSLTVDGWAVALKPGPASFPKVQDVTAGLGDISMEFTADLSPGDGLRELGLVNRHQSGRAVYLVNALQPSDPNVHILSQTRNSNQSSYGVTFSVGPTSSPKTAEVLRPSGGWPVMVTYFWRGVGHILTGYDHLLFVAALVLGAAGLWDLIKVVTAFTLAHSLTLALATFGLVHLDPRFVEPLISASIVFVAVQNLLWPAASRGGSRLVIAFIFGLAHGMGFASGLLEIMHNMPARTAIVALIGFSLGIETGNQLVLLPLFGAVRLVRRTRLDRIGQSGVSDRIQRFGSAGIALAGAYYLGVALIAPS